MANGILFSTESLPVTPKYRHVSNDSNSENTPPELFTATVGSSTCDLFCTEVIDERELQKPVLQPRKPSHSDSFNHPPVKANSDSILLKDDRVLQNLLRNEERYAPINPDYFKYIQVEVKPHMRKIVADWMLEVTNECSPPEVFCLAINLMDRFLAKCRIQKSQLQLVGAVCLFLASKFKETSPLTSDKLAMYTDFSASPEDIKEWELLVLYKLKWDLCAATGLDFLDHLLPRLPIHPHIDQQRLRRHVETSVALSSTLYTFAYTRPSVIAASSIALALRSMTPRFTEEGARKFLHTLQQVTSCSSMELETTSNALLASLPAYLTQPQTNGETSPTVLVSSFEKTSLMVKSC